MVGTGRPPSRVVQPHTVQGAPPRPHPRAPRRGCTCEGAVVQAVAVGDWHVRRHARVGRVCRGSCGPLCSACVRRPERGPHRRTHANAFPRREKGALVEPRAPTRGVPPARCCRNGHPRPGTGARRSARGWPEVAWLTRGRVFFHEPPERGRGTVDDDVGEARRACDGGCGGSPRRCGSTVASATALTTPLTPPPCGLSPRETDGLSSQPQHRSPPFLPRLQELLTLFAEFFASFDHSTCALSVPGLYASLRRIHAALQTAVPSHSTLGYGRPRDDEPRHAAGVRDGSPRW